jgi:hypothetical protein
MLKRPFSEDRYEDILTSCDTAQALAAQQLIERQIRRDIQYRWILRLILRQNTVHLFTPRQPADGHPEDVERPWSTSMEPENVHVK